MSAHRPHPFSPDYVGQLAKEQTTRDARARAAAGPRATKRRERLMHAVDADERSAARGTLPSISAKSDPIKKAKLMKVSQL